MSVLLLHTNGCFWNFSATGRYWKTANIIESVFYFAVPLFFMISGITLMDFEDKYSLKEFFIKRFRKTVIPFCGWSFIGLIYKVAVGKIVRSDVNIKYIYQGIMGTSIVGIYWFFTSLFIIYLCMPLYSAVDKSKRKNTFTYLVICGFVFNILLPFIKSVFKLDLNMPYSVTVVSGALIWVPLGWLLHNCELKRNHKIIVYGLAIMGLLMHITGTYLLSMRTGDVVRTFKGYQNVPCVLYSVGIFVLLKDVGTQIMNNKNVFYKLISFVYRYTFSIYLLQFILLDIFPRIPFVNTKTIIYRLGAPFIMIPIIIFVTWIIRKIPVIKYLVP